MAEDYLLPTRRAVLPRLKHDADLLTLIPAASQYPGTVPATRTSPFLRMGSFIGSPFRASGLDSSAIRFSVQGFTNDLKNGAGAVTASAEDQIHRIGSAIKNALDDATLTLESGLKLRIAWIQTSPGVDRDEAGAWMTTVTFRAEVAG